MEEESEMMPMEGKLTPSYLFCAHARLLRLKDSQLT